MKNIKLLALAATVAPAMAMAQDGGAVSASGYAYIAAGLCMGLAASLGAFSQSRAAIAALDGMSRNPAAAKGLFTPLVLSLALIEAIVILAFLISFFLTGK